MDYARSQRDSGLRNLPVIAGCKGIPFRGEPFCDAWDRAGVSRVDSGRVRRSRDVPVATGGAPLLALTADQFVAVGSASAGLLDRHDSRPPDERINVLLSLPAGAGCCGARWRVSAPASPLWPALCPLPRRI